MLHYTILYNKYNELALEFFVEGYDFIIFFQRISTLGHVTP